MTRHSPIIAAAICTYDRYERLEKAIESCIAQELSPEDFEIIIVDNSPNRDAAHRFGARYQHVPHLDYLIEREPGLSNARNVALHHSSAPIIAYLDDDAIADPEWLGALVTAYDSYGDAAHAAGGRITPIWESPRPDWLHDDRLGFVSVVDWGGSTRALGPGEWVAGANVSFRRDPLISMGGFNTDLGRKGAGSHLLSNEETKVLEALQRAGGQVLYVPEAQVSHLVDQRRLDPAWFRRRAAWQAVSDYMADPDLARSGDAAMDHALGFLLRQPPRHRNVAGIRRSPDDALMFNDQLDAIYNLTVAMLAGLEDVA